MFLGTILFILGQIIILIETHVWTFNNIQIVLDYYMNLNLELGLILIFLGLGLKIAFLPFIFWKIELYKYLPMTLIFLYSSVYLFIFISLLNKLNLLIQYSIITWYLQYLIILVGIIYIIIFFF